MNNLYHNKVFFLHFKMRLFFPYLIISTQVNLSDKHDACVPNRVKPVFLGTPKTWVNNLAHAQKATQENSVKF